MWTDLSSRGVYSSAEILETNLDQAPSPPPRSHSQPLETSMWCNCILHSYVPNFKLILLSLFILLIWSLILETTHPVFMYDWIFEVLIVFNLLVIIFKEYCRQILCTTLPMTVFKSP
jgi:prolipoprotein diacylglyceryltransferase